MGNSNKKAKVAPKQDEDENHEHSSADRRRRATVFARSSPEDDAGSDEEISKLDPPKDEDDHPITNINPGKHTMKKPNRKTKDSNKKRKTGLGDLPFYRNPNQVIRDDQNALEYAAHKKEHDEKERLAKQQFEAKKAQEIIDARENEKLRLHIATSNEEALQEQAKRVEEKRRKKSGYGSLSTYGSNDRLPRRGEPGYVPPEVRNVKKTIKRLSISASSRDGEGDSSSSDSDHLYEPNEPDPPESDRNPAYIAERERQRLHPKVTIDVAKDTPEKVETIHTMFGEKYPHVKEVDRFFGHLKGKDGRTEATFDEKVWYLFHPLEPIRQLEDIENEAQQRICVGCFDRTPQALRYRRTQHMYAPPETKPTTRWGRFKYFFKKSKKECCKKSRKRGGAGDRIDRWNQEHPQSWREGEYPSEVEHSFDWNY